jgi:ATP-dependent helicase/nuclease subunit B
VAISRFDLKSLEGALARSATIIVPSLRIKDAILAEVHNKHSRKAYRAPSVFPIDVWIKNLWSLRGVAGNSPCCDWQLMSGSQELFLWTQIIEESGSAIPLLNPQETAAQVSQSYQDIQQWALWDSLLDGGAHYQSNLDVATFIEWAKTYQAVCADRQLIGLVDCTRKLIETFEDADDSYLPEEIALSNFDDPPPLYARLFTALASVTHVASESPATSSRNLPATRYVFTDRDQEIKNCAQWALSLCETEPSAHIGVIMPSAAPDKGAVIRCFEDIFKRESAIAPVDREALFNNTGDSVPLTNFGMIHDALLLLSLLAADQDSNEICRLLQSPFVMPHGQETESLLHAQTIMRRNFSSRCSAAEISEILGNTKLSSSSPQFAHSLLKSKTRLRSMPSAATPRQWSQFFTETLEQFQWPGLHQSDNEKKLLTLWQEGLTLFSESSASLGRLNHRGALKRFRNLLSNLSPRPGFSSKRQLSFYTVSESIGLRFDHAWLLGFDDQSWPPPASPSPFLPYELQREHQMPASHGENQFAMAQQSFNALIACVQRDLIYSHFETDSDQQLRASSFIKSTPATAANAADTWPLNLYSKSHKSHKQISITSDIAAPVLAANAKVRGGVSVLSNQSSCPFRGFAKHRLNANTLQEFNSGLSSMARGTAVHIAMEIFYSQIQNTSDLTTLPAPELKMRIESASHEAVAYLNRNFRRVMTPKFSEIEQTRLEVLLSFFVQLDVKRQDFSLVSQEKSYQWQHGNLHLTLKMDRVDRLSDDSLALIDYKTGKRAATRQSWLQERPEDMQLPLYFVVASESEEMPIGALSIAHVNIEKMEFTGLAGTNSYGHLLKPVNDDDKIEYTWEELGALWKKRISLLADEFIDSKANVNPVNDQKTCLYCGLQSLCRVQELRESISHGRTTVKDLT